MSPASHHSSPFLNSVADFMAVRRYGKRTIKSYLYWIKFFIVFHDKRHPEEMGHREVEQFLTHLAVTRGVSVATQKIALNALAFYTTGCSSSRWENLGSLIVQKLRLSYRWY